MSKSNIKDDAFAYLSGLANFYRTAEGIEIPKKPAKKLSASKYRPTWTKCPKCGKRTPIRERIDYANDEVYTFIDCESCGHQED